MSSYLSSLLSAFGGRGGNGAVDSDDSDFEDAENTPLNNGGPTAAAKGPAAAAAMGKKGAGAASGKEQEPSVHWLSVQTTETDAKVVCEKPAASHLMQVGPETALNLVSIFGGARQGKSFLMNMLAGAGDDRLFRISNAKDPCTQGVDLSRRVLTWSQFHKMDDLDHKRRSLANASSEPRPHVAFVDVEGQGDRDVCYDANLTCPIVLASKAVLFNWKDSLQKDKLLNMLGIVARAAANVAPDEDEDGAAVGVSEPIFGHLLIVFRDWTYEGDSDSVHKTLFTPEQSNAPDAVLRNQIREAVSQAFQSITVWLLPPPVDQVAALRKELVASDLSQEFKAQVRRLRHALAEQLKEPKHFAGRVLTGPKIAGLVPRVVETLNSGERVLPRSAYASLIEAEVARVQAAYLRRLQKALQEVKHGAETAPLATPALRAKVQGEVHTLQRDFDRWLRTLGDDATALAAANAFHEHCGKGAEEVAAFNREHLLPKHMAQAAREAQGVFDARFALPALEPRLPLAPERLAAEHMAALAEAEAHVRRVVAGEPDAEALLGKDALPSLRTHAELAKTKAEAANKSKLLGVAEAERAAYEAARAGFEKDFFARLQRLKERGGGAVAEEDYLAAFDAALAAARRVLAEGVEGELTSAGRKAELEGFLTAAAEACKREQGVLYQLDCTEQLLTGALGACAALVKEVGVLVSAPDTFPAASEAALQAQFKRVQAAAAAGLESQITALAATDAGKAACREAWAGVGDAAWGLLKAENKARAAAAKAAVKEGQESAAAASAAAAKAAEEEHEKAQAAVARLEEEVKGLRAGAAAQQEAAAAASKVQARVKELKARVAQLEGEKGQWAAERAGLEGAVAAAQQEAAAATAAAAASAASASKKRKAEAEAEEEVAKPPAKSRRKGGKPAAAAAAAAAAEGEDEEGDGMDVDGAVVKEEAEAEEAPAPAAKGKKAAAPKGRAAKGKAAAAASAVTSPGAKSKLEKAREEERKRIEETMAKRITRAGRGK